MSESGQSRQDRVRADGQRLQERRLTVLESLHAWVHARGVPQEEALVRAYLDYEAEIERLMLGPDHRR